jgi:hypothetical protein
VIPAVACPLSEKTLERVIVVLLFLLPFVFYGKYLFGGRMLHGTDWIGAGGYMIREFMARYISGHHSLAYWMPHILSGQPTGAAFFADMFYPTLFLRLVLPVHVVWTWTFTLHLSLAGLGVYLFLKELKLGPVPAGLAGVAYMFSGSLVTLTYAGHDGRLIGSALAPFALLFLHRGMTRRQLVQFLLMGLFMGLQLLSGHIQKVYYTGLIVVAYFLFMLISTLRLERSALLGVRLGAYFAVGLGFMAALSAIQYLPIYANMPYASRGSERGYAYASSWSMPVIETFDLLTPRFSGGLDAYWGANPFKLHSEYLGILPLLFAAIAVFRRWRDRFVRFFTFSFLGSLLMAWGGNTPFYRIPFYLFPGVSKFRGPAMIFFLAALSLVVLAGFGIDHLLREFKQEDAGKTRRTALIAGAVPLGLFVLFGALKGPLTSLLRSATMQSEQKFAALEANYPNIVSGLLLAALLAAAGFVLAYLLLGRRIKLLHFAATAAIVMVLDSGISFNLWNEAKGYIRGMSVPREYFAADDAVTALKSDTSLFRVLPLNFERSDEGLLMYHGIQSTGGQMPNPLQSYQDFIGAGTSVMFQAGNLMLPNFMNLANVKYVIAPTLPEDVSRFDQRSQQYISQLKAYLSQPTFAPVHAGPRYSVYENTRALPRAFMAQGYEVVKDKDEVITRLSSPGFDPAAIALLYETPGSVPPIYQLGLAPHAIVTSHDANQIAVRTQSGQSAILVLSENWHPEWKAWVDGKPAPVLRAYHTFRAVAVPEGEHEVVFRYDNRHYRTGGLLTLASLLFLAGTAVITSLLRRRHEPGLSSVTHH